MFKTIARHYTQEEEPHIALLAADATFDTICAMLRKEDVDPIKHDAANIHRDCELDEYLADLIFATREPIKCSLVRSENFVEFGACPRATRAMFKPVKAMAYFRGNNYVSPIDIALCITDVFTHRDKTLA